MEGEIVDFPVFKAIVHIKHNMTSSRSQSLFLNKQEMDVVVIVFIVF